MEAPVIRPEDLSYRYTLGIDPSGAFVEDGKGTTGWCIMDNLTRTIIEIGCVSARNYQSNHEYWEAHLTLIKRIMKKYAFQFAVSIENYILYEKNAQSQVNSTLETVQVIAIIKQYCWQNSIKYAIRPAVFVKKRFSNEILAYHNVIYMVGTTCYTKCRPEAALLTHELDAIRHAMFFATFENRRKEDEENNTKYCHIDSRINHVQNRVYLCEDG